jgi:TPR repeat protein
MYSLAFIYDDGDGGVEGDEKEAAKWYGLAANAGNSKAQANLAQMYLTGRGVPLDLVQAYKWSRLSANQHDPIGQHDFQELISGHALNSMQIAQGQQLVEQFKARLTNAPVAINDPASGH